MELLDDSCFEIVCGFLGVKDLIIVSQLSHKWQEKLAGGTICERIFKVVAEENFGGPADNKNGSWRHACIVWEKTRINQIKLPLHKRIAWAVSKGHGALLSKMWKYEKIDITELKEPKHILASAASKGYYSIVAWCAEVGIPADWVAIVREMARKGLSGENLRKLVSKIDLDIQKIADDFIQSRINNTSLLNALLRWPGVTIHRPFAAAVASNHASVLETVKQYYIELHKAKRERKEDEKEEQRDEKMWEEVLASEDVFETLLATASEKHFDTSVEWLVKNGADVNQITPYRGFAPLHYAVRKLSTVQILVSHGADINLFSFDYFSPLHCACAIPDNKEVISYLIENGANINACAPHPDALPVLFHTFQYIPFLLDLGANPLLLSSSGDNIISHIIRRHSYYSHNQETTLEILNRLFQAGVDPNHKNNNGKNALLWRKARYPFYLVQWLVEVGKVEVTEKDNKENTSLMCIMSSQDEPNRATEKE